MAYNKKDKIINGESLYVSIVLHYLYKIGKKDAKIIKYRIIILSIVLIYGSISFREE